MLRRTLCFILQSFFLLNITKTHAKDKPPPNIPAILVFGDSTVDTGNNNYISTALKGNHSPYGVDYPSKEATGRFSDGLLVPDILASQLGIKPLVPPFLSPSLSDEDIRKGVCFASAGSGLDNLTSAPFGIIPVLKQADMFRRYVERLKGVVGEKESKKIVSEAFILISAGSNDFVINWYEIPSRRIGFPNIGSYQDFVLQSLRDLIKGLFDLGGRKFAIAGLPPIGCVPIQIKTKSPWSRTCIPEQNSDSSTYNDKLQKLLPEIQASLQGSKLAYINLYDPTIDIINHPSKYGIAEVTKGCCGTGYFEVGALCSPVTPICSDASKYAFWDSIHPTEAVYKIIAQYIIQNVVSVLY